MILCFRNCYFYFQASQKSKDLNKVLHPLQDLEWTIETYSRSIIDTLQSPLPKSSKSLHCNSVVSPALADPASYCNIITWGMRRAQAIVLEDTVQLIYITIIRLVNIILTSGASKGLIRGFEVCR